MTFVNSHLHPIEKVTSALLNPHRKRRKYTVMHMRSIGHPLTEVMR
jgi:hypothetical protein